MGKPPSERTHRREAEAAKRDAYRCRYEQINRTDFKAAWAYIAGLDPGLDEEPPELPIDARRAIIGLARRALELEHEWS